MDVSRYVDTTTLEFEVEFITPTFLGGADGNAEIRTAPFKNLLRRWWRIANGHLAAEELWKRESELFGSTEKNPDIISANKNRKKSEKEEKEPEIFGKSKVDVKILDKTKCKISSDKSLLFPNSKLTHPEVSRPIEVETYLGMGPIFWNKELKRQEYKVQYIIPKSRIVLSVTIPIKEKDDFIYIISLINYFGSIGSRSRNGWGSIKIYPKADSFNLINIQKFKLFDYANIYSNQQRKKYPHGIAKDEKGILCWKTKDYDTWDKAMKEIAEKYLKIRTAFKFMKTEDKILEPRHLLGYPITHHAVEEWEYERREGQKPKKLNTRLPSQLIIKICKENSMYFGQILHIPNLIPLSGFPEHNQKDIWNFVHGALDSYKLQRVILEGEKK